MQKRYYDTVSGKNILDIQGTKVEAEVIAEYGLDPACQCIEIDETFEATEVIDGTLTKFDFVARDAATKVTLDAEKAAKDASTQAALGLTDQQWADLKSVV